MPVSFEQFTQVCAAEKIIINPEVEAAGRLGRISPWQSMYDYVPLMAPIQQAGTLLRKDPSIQLINKPMERDFPPCTFARILRRILNTSVQRQVDLPGVCNIESGPIGWINSCAEAEDYFFDTFRDLRHKPQPCCDVFVHRDRPIILRKNHGYGASSSLSLARITINGVLFPAFSLLRAEALGDKWYVDDEGTYKIQTDRRTGVLQRPVGEITGAGFMRPTSLALSKRQRVIHFFRGLSWKEQECDTGALRRNLVNNIT